MSLNYQIKKVFGRFKKYLIFLWSQLQAAVIQASDDKLFQPAAMERLQQSGQDQVVRLERGFQPKVRVCHRHQRPLRRHHFGSQRSRPKVSTIRQNPGQCSGSEHIPPPVLCGPVSTVVDGLHGAGDGTESRRGQLCSGTASER